MAQRGDQLPGDVIVATHICPHAQVRPHDPVPGSASRATQLVDVEQVVRFRIEIAKLYGGAKCSFSDDAEFNHLVNLYGEMTHLQTLGRPAP